MRRRRDSLHWCSLVFCLKVCPGFPLLCHTHSWKYRTPAAVGSHQNCSVSTSIHHSPFTIHVPCPMIANRLRMPSRLLDLCLCIWQMLQQHQQQQQLDLSRFPCCFCSLIKTKTKIDGCMQYERVIFLDCSTWIIWLPTSNKLDKQQNKLATTKMATKQKAIGISLDGSELIWKTYTKSYTALTVKAFA